MIEPKIHELLATNEARNNEMTTGKSIARFHPEFEGIHPFIDTNEGIRRLLILDLKHE